MEEQINEYKYLAYDLVDNYLIEIDLAKEYLEQLLYCYMLFDPTVDFEEFFYIITDVVVTLFY